MENQKFCQSCGMPMESSGEVFGTNADGSKNEDYCIYCYEKGNFTAEVTMAEMIEFCVPHMVKAHPEMSAEAARKFMNDTFPNLKRWA